MIHRSYLGSALLALLLATAGCTDETGDDTTGGGGSTSASSATGAATGSTASATGATGTASSSSSSSSAASSGAGGGGCDDPALVPAAQDAGDLLGIYRYLAQSTLDSPVDVLTFELVDTTMPATGARTITDAGYATCQTCVRLDLACDENLANCTKTFLADAGTMNITESGGEGGTFAGTLQNVSFIEVTIDGETSTPVAGGEARCWASYAFSATVQ